MDNVLVIDLEHHRSRERIKNLGEVFTPEQYVLKMLSLLDSKAWSDENVIFFEPSAGHGNIVLPLLSKRTNSLLRKFDKSGIKDADLSALATALNTLWAIDICPTNIEHLRTRIFGFAVQFILTSNQKPASTKIQEYLAHILCTILWQITENEALSALSKDSQYKQQASQTNLGKDWIKAHKHMPLNFSNDWCSHYESQQGKKTASILFERAKKFIETSISEESSRNFSEFSFARPSLEALSSPAKKLSGAA